MFLKSCNIYTDTHTCHTVAKSVTLVAACANWLYDARNKFARHSSPGALLLNRLEKSAVTDHSTGKCTQ